MKLIIAGGRDFSDYDLLKNTLDNFLADKVGVSIITGGAKGADELGERYGRENYLSFVRFLANWDLYGKSAGVIRNKDMAEYASDDDGCLIAFWDGKSKGTKNMIDTAKRYNLKVLVVNY